MNEEAKSEFGKGLAVCLLHFANHWDNDMWQRVMRLEASRQEGTIPEDESSMISIYGTIEAAISSQITFWANGAADHLYEMEAPTSPEWSGVAHKVKMLKEIGLEMGHGFTNQQYTVEDTRDLFRLGKEIALEIDKLIGLEPDEGRYQ